MPKNMMIKNDNFQLSDCRVFFDFDNTMTLVDVVDDIIKRFSINEDWVVLENAWDSGEISTIECLTGQMRGVRVSKDELNKYLKTIALDPHFPKLLQWLRSQGIEPVIVSDNFQPIISRILKHNGIKGMTVYANQLDFLNDRVLPSFPYKNPNCSFCAHCKKTHFQKDNPLEQRKIVYVGDGRSDICAAIESDLVFAKDSLLKYFKKNQRPCIEFTTLADVHDHLREEVYESAAR